MSKTMFISLAIIFNILTATTLSEPITSNDSHSVSAQGLMGNLSNRDTVWSPPSTAGELGDICMKQSGGDTSVCNKIFESCEQTSLTFEECYAANFVDVNAEGVPSSVVESANKKLEIHLQTQALETEALYDQLYGPDSGFAESFCAPYCN